MLRWIDDIKCRKDKEKGSANNKFLFFRAPLMHVRGLLEATKMFYLYS